jgi:hypothetical protein
MEQVLSIKENRFRCLPDPLFIFKSSSLVYDGFLIGHFSACFIPFSSPFIIFFSLQFYYVNNTRINNATKRNNKKETK